MPASKARMLLGQDTNSIVFNAWNRFDPDAFAAVSGTVSGGGFLLLLTPPLADWPSFPDPDKDRVTVYPLPAAQTGGRYLQRLANCVRESDDVLLIEQGRALPVFSTTLGDLEKSRPGDWECRTEDQLAAVRAIEKVALGHRRRPLVITSDRGRGKTSALGIAAAHLLCLGINKIIVTAPRYTVAELVFERVKQLLPEAEFSRGLIVYQNSKIKFIPPDELSLQSPQADLVCVDEAAAIPTALLEKLLRRHARIVFVSTVHGYEGSGRGFAIRFADILSERAPGWKSLQLKTPVRWADNDPLERFVTHALLLDATVSKRPVAADFAAGDCTIERLDRDILAGDKNTLTGLFGLLVQAHYRTSPIDLRHLLDGPNISLYVARDAGEIIATALVAAEGSLDEQISEQIYAGRRRPQGHLLPQTLAVQGGFQQAPGLRYLRILRVAVDARVQRRGLGSALIRAVIADAETNGFDSVGASFSLLPDMLEFWRSSGFQPVLIGMKKNTASAAHSVVVLRGISASGKQLHDIARTRFKQILPHWLSDPLRNLETGIALELLRQAGQLCPLNLNKHERRDLQSFADGQRGYEVNMLPLWKLLCMMLPRVDIVALLSSQECSALIARVMQKRSAVEVAQLAGLDGRAAVTATMRLAIQKIIRHARDNDLWDLNSET